MRKLGVKRAQKLIASSTQGYKENEREPSYRNPLMLDDLINGQSLLGVGFEEASDQVLGVLRHVLPLWIGKLVLAGADALLHTRRYC